MKDEEGEGHSSPKRKKLFHKKVSRACLLCKKAHAACDIQRPCARCVCLGKANECTDALPKKRGRKPKLLPHHNSSFYNVITASNPQSTAATNNHHLDELVVNSDGGEDFGSGHQPPTTKPSAGEEASPYSSSSSPLSLSSFSSSATHLLSSSQTAPPTLLPHQHQPSLPSSSVGLPRQQSSYSSPSPSFVNSTTPLNGNNRSSSPQHFGGGGAAEYEEDEEEDDDLPPKKSRKTLQRNRSRSSGKSKLRPTNVARQDSGGEPVAVLSQHAASQHSFPQSLSLTSSSGPQRTSPPPSSNYQVYASGAPVGRSYSPSGDSLSPPPSAHRQHYRHQHRPSDHSLLDLESDSAFHTSSMPQPSASISGSEYGATDHSATSPLTPFSFPTSHPPPQPQHHQHRHQQHHQHYAYQQQQQRGGDEQNFLMKKERTGSPPPHAMVAGMPSFGSASAGQASSTSAGAIATTAIAASDTSDSLPFSATPSPAAILSRHNLSTTTGSGIEELPNSHKSDLLSSLLREIRHFKNTNRELTELVAQLRSSHLSLKLAFEELQREQRRCQWELENMRKEQLIANERFSIQSRHYQPSSSPSTSSSMATLSAPSALPAPSQAAQTTPTEYALSSAAGSLLDTPLSFSSTSSFTSSSSPSLIDAELRFPFSYAQHHNDLPAPSNSSEHRVTPSTTSSVPIFSVSDSNKPFGIFKKGRNDGVLIAANDAFCKLFHFTLSEILGLSWKTFVAPQSFELCKQLITPMLSSKYSGSSPIITKTVTYKTKDGLYFDALTNHQLYYDDSGMASWSVMSFERVLEQHGTAPTKQSSHQQQQIPYSESELDAGGSQHQREALSPTTFLCAFERGSSPPSPQALDLYPNHSSPLMIDTDVITTSSSTSTESVLRQAALSSQSQSLQTHSLLHGSGSAPQMQLRNPLHSAQTALSEELFGGMATMSNGGSSPAMLGLSSSETAGPANHVSIASSSGNNALLSVREQQRFTQDESVPSRGRRGDGGEEQSQSTGRSSGFRP